MLIIAFICLLVVCLATGTIYSIYSNKENIINKAVKLSALLSCCLLAVVTANLTSAIGGYSIFIIIALVVLLCSEALNRPDLANNKGYYYVKSLTLSLGFVCVFVAGIIFAGFNLFTFIAGLFIGGGLICLEFALTRRNKNKHQLISESLLLGFMALALSQGITMVISTINVLVGVFYLLGMIFSCVGLAIKLFKPSDNKILNIICNALYILGLIFITCSIYFI